MIPAGEMFISVALISTKSSKWLAYHILPMSCKTTKMPTNIFPVKMIKYAMCLLNW